MEEIRKELKELSTLAPSGSNVKVAENLGISTTYLYQIRTGKNLKVDNENNRIFLKKIIKEYKIIINQLLKKYSNI